MRIPNIHPTPILRPIRANENSRRGAFTLEKEELGKLKEDSPRKNVSGKDANGRINERMEEFCEDLAYENNGISDILQKGILLKLHKETERYFVQVIDVETQEVLKELPPEEFLDLVSKIRNIVGLFLDESI